MKRTSIAIIVLISLLSVPSVHAQLRYSRNNTAVESAFRECIANARKSVVEVYSDNKLVSLGMAVAKDGYLVTKFSEIGNEIECKLSDGKKLKGEVVGVDGQDDIALVKVKAKLTPVEWDMSPVKVGSWIATPGQEKDPISVGVISVAVWELEKLDWDWDRGFMGIQLRQFSAIIEQVTPDSPAAKAGLRRLDHILQVDELQVKTGRQFIDYMKKKKLGQSIELKLRRNNREFERTIRLGHFPGINVQQNRLGGKLSRRKVGFRRVFQHDTIIKPAECGGPIVNLDGKVVGMNISRKGRVETYAIPVDALMQSIEKLKPKAEVKAAAKKSDSSG